MEHVPNICYNSRDQSSFIWVYYDIYFLSREIIHYIIYTMLKIDTHKCSIEGCDRKTTTQVCGTHAKRHYKLNPCGHAGCIKMCRKEFCYNHKPETMAKNNIRTRDAYHANRALLKTIKA
jgi:hypothetical protein